ncbi:AAA family ATPase [Moraxella oblonga]|uniref:AAA family ATPase n=1 Tax=Moraxella oblonga TaxID=200413 RepID=UPI000A065AE6|nr:AAA family ATPase [Moraxella oblonga]
MNNWQIKDLKGVGDVELNLDSNQRVFTFLGTNGVGKTKTLESLLIWFLVQQKDFVTLFEKTIYSNGKTSLAKNIILNNKNLSFKEQFPKSFIEQFSQKQDYVFSYVGAKYRSELVDKKYLKQNSQNNLLNSYFSQIIQAIVNDDISELGFNKNIHQWIIDRARFINPYQIERDNSQLAIESVLQCLHKIDSVFDDKFLQINENDNVYLKVNGEVLELSELSSGFLSLVKIIQSIIASFSAFTNEKDLLNVKGVVLIDEIESHLHLEWQVKIIPILKNLFPNTTFYITTHSPLVLSQLNEGEAYLLKRDEDNVVRSHIINSPNTRTLSNVLIDAFGINLNQLKIDNISNINQSKVKNKLLELLDK